MEGYYDKRLREGVDDLIRDMLCNQTGLFKNVIFPVFDQKSKIVRKLCIFLYRKTRSKRFVTGWECNGKHFDRDTPMDDMIEEEEPKYVQFVKYIPFPKIDTESEEINND